VEREKIICCITDGLDIRRQFNMSCSRMLKYRNEQLNVRNGTGLLFIIPIVLSSV
jgi:hypothetical protein